MHPNGMSFIKVLIGWILQECCMLIDLITKNVQLNIPRPVVYIQNMSMSRICVTLEALLRTM